MVGVSNGQGTLCFITLTDLRNVNKQSSCVLMPLSPKSCHCKQGGMPLYYSVSPPNLLQVFLREKKGVLQSRHIFHAGV